VSRSESDTSLDDVDENGVGGMDAVSPIATLEPDADGDGFGDETQDSCPGAGIPPRPPPRPQRHLQRA
jgi:hypothetical protein